MSDSDKVRLDELAGDRPGARHLDVQTVHAEVSRIRTSRFFRHSPRLARFLAFTVEKTLAGSAGDLKEYLIGVEVYGRRAGFDPKGDSIVRSEAVRLRHRLRQYYEVEGAQNTLRISYPKGGYVPAFEPSAAVRDASDPGSPRTSNTIAVLPFVTVGGTADTQAFGEGLAEELIYGLGQAPGFRVVARSSSFAFEGKAVDVREAGRRLNAEAVLEGTVRCWRGQVRVTAQLVDVATGLQLWSERFDRTLDHLFALQDEMARRIVGALGGRLARAVRAPAEPESYRLYLKGRLHWARYSVDGAERSCAFYERALEASPRYARAWAGLAFSLLFLSHRGRATADNAERARHAIDTALAIDETLPDAHAARALLLGFIDRNWAEAERSVRKALQLAPGDAGILHQAGVCLLITGQFDEAGTLIRRAGDLDPLACHYQMDLGILLRVQGRHDEAIGQIRAALEIDPHHRESLWQLGLALQQAGRFDEALASFGRATIDQEEQLPAMGTTGHCYAASGRPEVAKAMLKRLESAQGQEAAAMLYARALIHVALGEHEHALGCLESCAALSTSRLVLLKYDWRFAPLVGYARFDAILVSLGCAPS